MKLEKLSNKSRPNEWQDEADHVEYIHPLESIEITRATGFTPKTMPTEQGELLLEFIRRHLFKARD